MSKVFCVRREGFTLKNEDVFYNDEGIIAFKSGNTDKAREYWQISALKGNKNAMFELGVAELCNQISVCALLKAREWFNCAMQQGHRNAELQIEKIDSALANGDYSMINFSDIFCNSKKPDFSNRDKVYFGGIEWLKLISSSGRFLCLSADIITVLPYNDELKKTSWKSCSLRKWLNTSFMERFTDEERRRIIRINCLEDGFIQNNENDSVFLLSLKEVEKIFNCRIPVKNERFDLLSESDMNPDLVSVLNLSEYEIKHIREKTGHDYSLINGKAMSWWLRDNGVDSTHAARVNCRGVIRDRGREVNRNLVGVRPAIWLRGE